MTRDLVFNRVKAVFGDIFDEDNLVIENFTSADDIEDWDSLNHINLLTSIEKEFLIKFTLTEMVSLKDVGAMVDLIIEKSE
jgi:acyl carrier protein